MSTAVFIAVNAANSSSDEKCVVDIKSEGSKNYNGSLESIEKYCTVLIDGVKHEKEIIEKSPASAIIGTSILLVALILMIALIK